MLHRQLCAELTVGGALRLSRDTGECAQQPPFQEKNSLLLLERLAGALIVLWKGSVGGCLWAETLHATEQAAE